MSSTRSPPQPHLQQACDLIPEGVTPLKEVVPEDTGHARVCQDVGIPLAYPVVREGPVRLRAAGVMAARQRNTQHTRRVRTQLASKVRRGSTLGSVARQHVVRLFVEG